VDEGPPKVRPTRAISKTGCFDRTALLDLLHYLNKDRL
jgi:hypothetical protein